MGIDENDHVVVYDSVGIFSACRVYWTFKVHIDTLHKTMCYNIHRHLDINLFLF